MTKGMKVTARKSQCIGIIPTTWAYEGTIEKVNKKSIVVGFSRMTRTFGSKVEVRRI